MNKTTLILAVLLTATCCGKQPANPGRTENLIKDSEGDKAEVLLKGGDISVLTLVEQKGGKYYLDGKENDCVKILASQGFNIVRLRLYNDPGNPSYDPSKQMYTGIEDEADILNLAKRAKAEGLQIELTFHYSDYWTNGGTQVKPHDWSSLSYADLKTAVYDYTKAFLQKMVAQKTTPEYVSLGNEIQGGLLYPDGSMDNPQKTAELFSAGAKAVREICPDAKIVIHLDDAGNVDKYKWFFGEMKKNNLDYDIIGASYYPFWTNKNVAQLTAWANVIGPLFGKKILIMETGYAWNETLPSGWKGQIQHNGPYNDMTKAGQKAFMEELFTAIASSDWMIGDLYWDPIFIPAGDAGWIPGGPNVVSNTALFDFEGNALEVFDAYKKQY